MAISAANSFGTRDKLNVGAQSFDIHRLEYLEKKLSSDNMAKLPFSLRILLENLLRNEDGRFVRAEDIKALASWKPGCVEKEIAFMPARVLLQDFTGVPAIVDLARWQDWTALQEIVPLYQAKPPADAATRRAIVGYLRACPTAAASAELKRLRTADPNGVAEAEQVLSAVGGGTR